MIINIVFVIIYLVPCRGWSLKLNVTVYKNISAPLIWFTYAKTVLSITGVHCCIDHQNINSTKLRHCLKYYTNFMHSLCHCPPLTTIDHEWLYTSWISLLRCSASPTWQTTPSTIRFPGSLLSDCTARSTLACLRLLTITLAPSCARRRAMLNPIL